MRTLNRGVGPDAKPFAPSARGSWWTILPLGPTRGSRLARPADDLEVQRRRKSQAREVPQGVGEIRRLDSRRDEAKVVVLGTGKEDF